MVGGGGRGGRRKERLRRDADGVEQGGGQRGEGEVEQEARVGLESQDAGGGAEDGGCQALQVREGLFFVFVLVGGFAAELSD